MNVAQHILILFIRVYRWVLSPAKAAVFGPFGRCRFTPSCSTYALEAVQAHGALAGSWLAARRICRCHPWGDCGHDPVPPRAEFSIFNFQFSISNPSRAVSAAPRLEPLSAAAAAPSTKA
ncbi:MAG: membrane protein insertion efficiency factor YidD [Verrucomicrobia bacterium]|nr:membrane protein insertion efficiency factor YidD [Verrucomicrobiota bacterium]